MTISMYQASAPVFVKLLGNLKGILQKAAAHAQDKKIDESAFLSARLFPDMLPFTSQVHIATDFARGTCARLAGAEPPSIDSNVFIFFVPPCRCVFDSHGHTPSGIPVITSSRQMPPMPSRPPNSCNSSPA